MLVINLLASRAIYEYFLETVESGSWNDGKQMWANY